MKVQWQPYWLENPITEDLEEYLMPNGNGIEDNVYKLRQIVAKLLAVAVENKQLTLARASWLAREENDSTAKLIEEQL